jgi:hypothetical protein
MADGVLFEFGPSRQGDLALRSRILQWQPQLRAFFVTRIALVKYRLQLPGFELPEPARMAQQEFDNRLPGMLDGMADRMEGKPPQGTDRFEDAFERLEQTVRTCCSEGSQELLTAEMQTFLTLSRSVENMTISLDKEIWSAEIVGSGESTVDAKLNGPFLATIQMPRKARLPPNRARWHLFQPVVAMWILDLMPGGESDRQDTF